jgi:hypothetical protein
LGGDRPADGQLCAEVCGEERVTVAYGWVFAGLS